MNHYYLYVVKEEQADAPVENHFFAGDDPGTLVSAAGVGIVQGAENDEAARKFVDFLLSEQSQTYFRDETYEYPLIEGVEADEQLTPLEEIESPDVDLSDLADLQGTLDLMQEVGIL